MSKHHRTRGAFGKAKNRPINNPHTPIKFEPLREPLELPTDIKTDIAKVVRSLAWEVKGAHSEFGYCFFRVMSGIAVLTMLGIPSSVVRGGMLFRAGEDPLRDVLAYCGPGNRLFVTKDAMLGHYWLVSGLDLIDFTPGDWRADAQRLFTTAPAAEKALGPIQWTAPAVPDFLWDRQIKLMRESAYTPELGDPPVYVPDRSELDFEPMFKEYMASHKAVRTMEAISRGIELYALRERIFAEREGHTAVSLVQLARLLNDPAQIAKANRENQLFVLRGKREITRELALEILSQQGI
jgi:hypothetical protein